MGYALAPFLLHVRLTEWAEPQAFMFFSSEITEAWQDGKMSTRKASVKRPLPFLRVWKLLRMHVGASGELYIGVKDPGLRLHTGARLQAFTVYNAVLYGNSLAFWTFWFLARYRVDPTNYLPKL